LRKFILLLVVISGMLMISGCGGPTLDTSSQDAFKKSVEEVSKTLDAPKREKFESAVSTLMLSKVVLSPDTADEASMQKKVKELFDGKSVDDIIADGEKAQAEAKSEMEKLTK